MEDWRTVEGYPNYKVSSLGNVKSIDRIVIRNGNKTKLKGKILKPKIEKNGYLRVTLYNGRKDFATFSIHRLVALAFIPNPNNYLCVNHKDENPQNNNVNNLEWCTHKYNSNYGTAIKRRVIHQDWESISNKQSKVVIQFDKNMKKIKEYRSTVECSKYGYNSSSVSKCCNGKLKTYKGFIWRYK